MLSLSGETATADGPRHFLGPECPSAHRASVLTDTTLPPEGLRGVEVECLAQIVSVISATDLRQRENSR